MDSVFDTKPAPFRILHQTPSSEVYYGKQGGKDRRDTYRKLVMHRLLYLRFNKLIINFFFFWFSLEIASALTREDILKDWEWLSNNLFNVLNEMESEEEITNFTICKIQSLVAHNSNQIDDITDSSNFQVVASKFKERFNMPEDERLVIYYSCRSVSCICCNFYNMNHSLSAYFFDFFLSIL